MISSASPRQEPMYAQPSAPPLAAMAVQAGISPKALDITALQARLREHGAILNV